MYNHQIRNHLADPVPSISIRAPSVHYLETVFLDEVLTTPGSSLTRESSIDEIEKASRENPGSLNRSKALNVPCLRNGWKGAAFVDCIPENPDYVGEATHLLSYAGSHSFGEIIDSLVDFCSTSQNEPKRTFVWISCFCTSHHQKPQRSLDLLADFGARISKIGHVLALMSPWNDPSYLKSAKCLCELFIANSPNRRITLVMPSSEHLALANDIFVNEGKGLETLLQRISKILIQNAVVESDCVKILVEADPGYGVINHAVSEILRDLFEQTIQEIITVLDRDESVYGIKIDCLAFAKVCNQVASMICRHSINDTALRLSRMASRVLLSLVVAENGQYPDGELELATCRTHIGDILQNQGNYEEALTEYRHALYIREHLLGRDHVETAASHRNVGSVLYFIGSALYFQGKLGKALGQLRSSLQSQEAGHEFANETTAATYRGIGDILNATGDSDWADMAHNVAKAIQDEGGLRFADVHYERGKLFHQRRLYQAAWEAFERARLLYGDESKLGNSRSRTADCCFCIGVVMEDIGRSSDSLKEYQSALRLYDPGMEEQLLRQRLCRERIEAVANQARKMDVLSSQQDAPGSERQRRRGSLSRDWGEVLKQKGKAWKRASWPLRRASVDGGGKVTKAASHRYEQEGETSNKGSCHAARKSDDHWQHDRIAAATTVLETARQRGGSNECPFREGPCSLALKPEMISHE